MANWVTFLAGLVIFLFGIAIFFLPALLSVLVAAVLIIFGILEMANAFYAPSMRAYGRPAVSAT